MTAPLPHEVRRARLAAGLTQHQAARLVYRTLRCWQNWESAEGTINHRHMDAMTWEAFQTKAKRVARGQFPRR